MINASRFRWIFFVITIVALSLSGCGRGTPTAAPLDGPTVIADGPAPTLGVVIDTHNLVLHVEPNSMAAQAQLQPGDEILSVNGLALSDARQAVKVAIAQTTSMSPLALRVSRNRIELNLSAVPPSSIAPIPVQPIATTTPVMPPDDYL
jgi:membrane-associated protease RseP (regulator of RpoE activity)